MNEAGFAQRVQALQAHNTASTLQGMRRGIEKESLRVTPDGKLAQTPHPAALGSALKHPNITTDFSEALLEFITPACNTIEETLQWMENIHRVTCPVLAQHDELLWVSSMPCVLQSDEDIPIAQYGSSHSARMKTTYRVGLGHRYGRLMQTIAGIHYNVSFPDAFWSALQSIEHNHDTLQHYKTQRYFDTIRNLRRHIGVLLLVTGASPAVCPSFVRNRLHRLQPFEGHDNSLCLPYATSLRMGDLGYQSHAQAALHVYYNNLESYIRTLKHGLTQSHPAYAAIGVRDAAGHYRQLNTNVLQIENEFYATVRPKRITRAGETPIHALHERGVEYLEVRCIDLNPFLPVGIDADTARVLEVFLLWCLLTDSPPADATECERMAHNQKRCVERGRDPGLLLDTDTGRMTLKALYAPAHAQWLACAALLDSAYSTQAYHNACEQVLLARLADVSRTPSAHVLQTMREQDVSFFRLAKQQSAQQAAYFAQRPPDATLQQDFANRAATSWREQADAEAASHSESFESYLARYFGQYASV